jgi:hypothetical protein
VGSLSGSITSTSSGATEQDVEISGVITKVPERLRRRGPRNCRRTGHSCDDLIGSR